MASKGKKGGGGRGGGNWAEGMQQRVLTKKAFVCQQNRVGDKWVGRGEAYAKTVMWGRLRL